MFVQHNHWGGWVLFCLLFSATTTLPAEAEEPLKRSEFQRLEFLQIRMGIPVQIIVYAADEPSANVAVKAAYDRFRELDRMLSDYDPESELMQLCKNEHPGIAYNVSPELFTVLTAAKDLSVQTEGAFDVTVGPVVKLWRIARRRKTMPEADRLQAALQLVGYQKVTLDSATTNKESSVKDVSDRQTVTFSMSNMSIDLGAIAKGFAADEALRILKEHGFPRALIDAGGDIVVGDPPPERQLWNIEVEKLKNAQDDATQPFIVHLKNAAIATSGDAYQFTEINGTRFSHIVNPKTGLGLTTPSSVSVIAPTGMMADGLASAVSVLGPEQGIKFIEQLEATEAFIVQLDEHDEKKTYSTLEFPKP